MIITDGYNFEGKQIRYTKTVHGTKIEAEIKLAKFVSEIQNGLVIVSNPADCVQPPKVIKFSRNKILVKDY